MAQSPPLHDTSLSRPEQLPSKSSSMAMIAVPLPAASTAFKQDRWDTGSANYPLSRPDPKSVALPSIRQVSPLWHYAHRSTANY